MFVLSPGRFCFDDHEDPASRKKREKFFFQVNQLNIHFSTGAPAPTGTALLALSKALPMGDTEMSRSIRNVAVLTPSTLECDCSQQGRQQEISEVPAENQTPIQRPLLAKSVSGMRQCND